MTRSGALVSVDAGQPVVAVVTQTDPAERLDTLVVALLARTGQQVSRSTVRRWIVRERVLVDGVATKPAARVRVGSTVAIRPEPPPPSEAAADPSVIVRVLFEDEHLLAVDKPAGLVVHPARGHWVGTLVGGLLARDTFVVPPIDDMNPDSRQRPGIVHRLDKDTSGVMVVARTTQAREALRALFAQHTIEREYLAVVVGRARNATYDTRFGRHPRNRLRFSTRISGEGKRAITHVQVVESLARGLATLVTCRLETGRTHQIRVHLSECGETPLLGDRLYGTRPRDIRLAAIGKDLGRQWLHAAVLGLRHPVTGQTLRFESPLPPDLAQALEQLRRIGLRE